MRFGNDQGSPPAPSAVALPLPSFESRKSGREQAASDSCGEMWLWTKDDRAERAPCQVVFRTKGVDGSKAKHHLLKLDDRRWWWRSFGLFTLPKGESSGRGKFPEPGPQMCMLATVQVALLHGAAHGDERLHHYLYLNCSTTARPGLPARFAEVNLEDPKARGVKAENP